MKFTLLAIFLFAAVGLPAPVADAVLERSAVAEPAPVTEAEFGNIIKRQFCSKCVNGKKTCGYCQNGSCQNFKYDC